MRFKVGDKVRFTGAGALFADEDFTPGVHVGDIGIVDKIDCVDDDDVLFYHVVFNSGKSWWVREVAIELDEPVAPTVTKGVVEELVDLLTDDTGDNDNPEAVEFTAHIDAAIWIERNVSTKKAMAYLRAHIRRVVA